MDKMSELLPVFVPVIVYWITVAVYEKLVIANDEYRLFTEEEEEAQNVVPPKEVVRGVLVNQGMQILLAVFYFMMMGRGKKETKGGGGVLHIGSQIAVALLVLDTWEYFWHRILHENDYLFKNFHAMHHFQKVPYSYGGQYVHPFDAFVGQLVGNALSVELSGMSSTTAAVFYSMLAIKNIDDHCSRWFPHCNVFQRFFRNNVAFHSVHHQLQGFNYNYSVHVLSTWDLLLGTYLPCTVEEKKGGGYRLRTAKDD
ncbi:sphinganine C4-monooxygenase 1-like isoform X2 [Wolffia australiana]